MVEIKRIESARHMDGEYWEIGQEVEGSDSGKFITEIRDKTDEWPDGIEHEFQIYVNGELWTRLINMPVMVIYKTN
ncbi:hypothetical protein [Salibacterium sp. K-3]